MPKLKSKQKEQVKSMIILCKGRGYNQHQVLTMVNETLRKTNNMISLRTLTNLQTELRKDSQAWFKEMSIGTDGAYIHEYHQRINELKDQKIALWTMVEKYQDDEDKIQSIVAIHREIHALTKSIHELYMGLPQLVSNPVSAIPAFSTSSSEDEDEDTTGRFKEFSAS